MNVIQKAIIHGSREQSGLWDVISDIATTGGLSRDEAFEGLKHEIAFLESLDDVLLLKSKGLYESRTCEVLGKRDLLSLSRTAVEFRESGPDYYLSNRRDI